MGGAVGEVVEEVVEMDRFMVDGEVEGVNMGKWKEKISLKTTRNMPGSKKCW